MTKKHRIAFVGGPMCGRVLRVPTKEICQYVGCVVGTREYLYKFRLVSGRGHEANPPLKIHRQYVFQGHAAKLPEVE